MTNEQDLLRGLAENDRKSVEKIYKDNYATIQSLIINNNGNGDDARDVFQEAMIVLYEKVKTGGFELNCQLRTYLYAVCRRIWLKKLQQGGRIAPMVDNLEESVPVEEDLEEHEQKDSHFRLMEKSLNNLGEPCKSLLEAYYLSKRNMQEIAEDFGYTNSDNAKNQKYKCLIRLKKMFFSQYKKTV